MKNINTLIILAGGASSRMKKSIAEADKFLTAEEIAQANQRSKGLITLGNNGYPLLDYLLYNAKKAGITRVVFLTGVDSKPFRDHFGGEDGNYHGLHTFFATQHIPEDRIKPLGTADALVQTIEQQPWLKEERFIVCNSDNLYSTNAFSLLMACKKDNAFISYDRDSLQFPAEKINQFALVKIDDEEHLEDIIEKPSVQESEKFKDPAGKFRVSMNIFMFSGAKIYPFVKNCPMNTERNEKELPTALLNMINDSDTVMAALPLSEHVPDLTSKEDIAKLKALLAEAFPEKLW